MNNKFNLKNTVFALTAILTIFFIAEYIYSKDYSILLLAVIIFSALVLICLFIYLLLLFDNRYKLTYADADELSDETKEKIIKEDIKEIKEVQKINYYKKLLYAIIYRFIYILGLFELIIIIHVLITDIDNINKILVNTFPAFLALIIAVTDIFKKLKK